MPDGTGKAFRISRLRHQIFIEEMVAGADAFGQSLGTNYRHVGGGRAEVKPVSSREAERAHSFGPQTNYIITMRWKDDIKTTQRVKFGRRKFLINGILNPEERDELLELYCQELAQAADEGRGG